MDNIKKILPIRNYSLQNPMFVVFNIQLPHYNAYGSIHYDRVYKALTNPRGANLDSKSVYLVPNVTNLDSCIESRGKSMAQHIERRMSKIGASNCHVVAHSFTGVDARAAISMFGA